MLRLFLKVRARAQPRFLPSKSQPFALGCDLGSAAPLQFLACGQERRESAAGLRAGFCGVSICVCNFKSSILAFPSLSGVREILLRFSFPPPNLGACLWLRRGTLRRCAGSGERAGQPFTGAAVHKFSATCGKVAPPSSVWRRGRGKFDPQNRTYVRVCGIIIPPISSDVKGVWGKNTNTVPKTGHIKASASMERRTLSFYGNQKYCLMPSGARSGSSLMVMVNLMPFFSPKLLSQFRKSSTSL